MYTFREFINEGYNVPVVSVDKEKTDLSNESTRNEINRNLAAVLASDSINPYGSWLRMGKILSMYGIDLPRVFFQDAEEGEEVVAISQFGGRWGADVSGRVTSPNDPDDAEYYLYYSYEIDETGFYNCFAVVTDEEGLNDFISDELESGADEVRTADISPEEQLEVQPG